MKSIEQAIKLRGYELVDETPPFRTYEREHKRIIYHIPSKKVWGKFYIRNKEKKWKKNLKI